MSVLPPAKPLRVRNRRPWRLRWLYFFAVLREFRWTFLVLVCCLALGTVVLAMTTFPDTGRPPLRVALYGAWMSILGEPVFNPPPTWYLSLLNAVFPLVGVAMVGEGVVRFALLMVSRREGEKEWM